MARTQSEESKRAEFGEAAEEMHRRLRSWRRAHPDATFDEIADQVSQERRLLMGELLNELSTEAAPRGLWETATPVCPTCGGAVQHKGKKSRQVLHREGETRLERDYYYCPACKQGFFPSGPELGTESTWLESGDDSSGSTPGR